LETHDFAAVLKEGKAIRGRGLSVLLKVNGVFTPRFGVIVPKRIVQRSVDRSRLKRILREWFRHNRERLAGQDCVIRLTNPQRDEGALLEEVERLIRSRG
jgi:ribonuclease P protein component